VSLVRKRKALDVVVFRNRIKCFIWFDANYKEIKLEGKSILSVGQLHAVWPEMFCKSSQMSILNFTPRGKLWPLGVNLSPGVEILCSPLHSPNSRECSPLGVNEGVKISPRGQSSPLVAKFTPRGKLHPGRQTGLRSSQNYLIYLGNILLRIIYFEKAIKILHNGIKRLFLPQKSGPIFSQM
jgi:hypothetical protein